jgi:hypothetical protein
MVGMSFQDSHINTLLGTRLSVVGLKLKTVPVGIISTQGRPWHDLDETTMQLLAEAEQTRLAELDVLTIVTSYFFQDATFLREVAGRTKNRKIPHYAVRRSRWETASQKKQRGRTAIEKKEGDLREVLQRARAAAEALIPPAGPDQRIKAELWLRDMSERGLRLAASSEMRMFDYGRAPFYPLRPDSPVAAVKAVTHGAPRTHDRDAKVPVMWRSFAAYPLHLAGDPWWDLPVGALVFASDLKLKSSLFSSQGSDLADVAEDAIPLITRDLNFHRRLI